MVRTAHPHPREDPGTIAECAKYHLSDSCGVGLLVREQPGELSKNNENSVR